LVGSHPSGPGSHSLRGLEDQPIDPVRRVFGIWNPSPPSTAAPALPVLQQMLTLNRFLAFIAWQIGTLP
jgi:hypothetical protein